jgi:hypothetical protein
MNRSLSREVGGKVTGKVAKKREGCVAKLSKHLKY